MSTALVLSGGGSVGMAWELGVLSGIVKAGVNLDDIVDLTVGTSAGSAVGIWFRSGSMGDVRVIDRLETLSGELQELTTQLVSVAASASGNQFASPATPMDAIPEAAYVSVMERLVGTQWPSAFLCAATDVNSGVLETWGQQSGVPLARAIAAACAWPGTFPPVTVAGRRYIDGGILDGLNPQLAAGYDTILGISCTPLASRAGISAGTARRLQNTRDALSHLESEGGRIVLVEPDSRFLAISENGAALLDVTRIRAAHAAGVELGADVAWRFALDRSRKPPLLT